MNTNGDWNQSIKDILSAITVESGDHFHFAGRAFPVQPAGHQHSVHAAPNSDPPHPLVVNLAAQLYEFAYSRPFRGQLPEAEVLDLSVDSELMEAMSEANSTRERWEGGWTISQILHHGQIVAQQGSNSRNVWPGQFISKDGPAAMPRPGAQISIFYAKESRSLQNGFYYAFGEEVEEHSRGAGLVRLYWNISPEGAPMLVRLITSRLNRFHVPFRFKCATARSQFSRTDVAVLYLTKPFFRITAELMLDVHPAVIDFLDDDVPLFSKKIAKGLGAAEDPGTGESFGQSRCQSLAQSVWDCYLRGEQSYEGRAREFRRLLQQSGIHPEHLHLNAGSLDWYELPRDFA
jgi:hypothetical protein